VNSGGELHAFKDEGGFCVCPERRGAHHSRKEVKAYVIDRKIFDREIVESSIDAGAELMLKTRFTGLADGGISVSMKGRKNVSMPDIIIGLTA